MASEHVPTRMCLACRERFAKRELQRYVRNPDGLIRLDPSGREPGRGAYLCASEACREKARRRRLLERELKGRLDEVPGVGT